MTTKKSNTSSTAEATKSNASNKEKINSTSSNHVVKSNKSFNIKSIAEIVKSTWGYFMTLLAVVTFIWTLGVKSERKTLDNDAIKKDLNELKVDVKKIDTLIIMVEEIKITQDQIIENQNSMRESYVKYLVKDPDLTKKDFIEYMDGLQFELKPTETLLPNPVKDTTSYKPKINVKKSNTTNTTSLR